MNISTDPENLVPKQFSGYAAFSADEPFDLKPHSYTPKPFQDYDIDIKVFFCGVCGSDIHVLRSGWSPTTYPVVVGHEIAGIAVRVGRKVTSIQVGDKVGVGAVAWSCGNCDACGTDNESEGEFGVQDTLGKSGGAAGLKGGNEQYCLQQVDTYNAKYRDGHLAYGGYADFARVHENFVFPIPEGIPMEIVAPMFCGGVTMYSPLKRADVGPGSKVGIVGIGGLGHFGVLLGSAMGAEVTAISHSPSKEKLARELGAKDFIVASGSDWNKNHKRTLDLIISTNFSPDQPLDDYLQLLKIGGTFIVCGIPEGSLPEIKWYTLASGNYALRGSNVGSKQEVLEMLKLVQDKDVKSWIQVENMKDAAEVVRKMDRGEARFRYVLRN